MPMISDEKNVSNGTNKNTPKHHICVMTAVGHRHGHYKLLILSEQLINEQAVRVAGRENMQKSRNAM